MEFIDLHCDTAGKIFYDNLDLNNQLCTVNIQNLKKGKSIAQVFAFFIDQKLNMNSYDEFLKLYNRFQKEIKEHSNEIEIVKNIEELKRTKKSEKIGAFLSIEEGEVVNGEIDKLINVYNMGIRIITVTWNYKNKLGYPNVEYKYKDKGLTEKGIEIIEACENLGIIPDASHLSDAGFYDLIKICKKPFIASHSNARKVTENPRNLSDDMIKALAEKGGVMGINFCSWFLGDKDVSSIEDMVIHIKHIKNIGGIDVISLGSDFDGILNKVEIENPSQFDKLSVALKKNGFNNSEIEKIFYKNVIRVFEDTLK